MTEIKAPYNFVPLNETVFLPPWGPSISHDVPFKGGKSGHIKLKITAETPIFVRGGGQEAGTSLTFSNLNGKYFIPGSSLKGMLRAVLEIMSFGKFTQFNDHRYGIRDFTNPRVYTLLNNSNDERTPILGGWLIKREDAEYPYEIHACGQAKDRQCPHESIKPQNSSHVEHAFSDLFKRHSNYYNVSNGDQKTAKYKYQKYYRDNITAPELYQEELDKYYVFTGQPSYNDQTNRNGVRTGKSKEFEFPSLKKIRNQEVYLVSKDKFEDFLFIYGDHDTDKMSDDWKFFKPRLEAGDEIPVFFTPEPDRQKVQHFGLSMLYKLPYKKSVGDLIKNIQKNIHKHTDIPDLAECIFGYTTKSEENTSQNNKKALKGRVYIKHAFAQGNPVSMGEQRKILLGPRASYYPTYIEQNNVQPNGNFSGNYKTMMDEDAQIRGYKRYPVHHNFNAGPGNTNQGNVETRFKPLSANTTFETLLYYHNLLPEELGALFSAITFHNTSGCRHSLGMAKPLGYGKVKVEIDWDHSTLDQKDLPHYLYVFENTMNESGALQKIQWHTSDQLKELISMAWDLNGQDASKLTYMSISEYVDVKRRPSKALPSYSKFIADKSQELNSCTEQEQEKGQSFIESEINKIKSEINKYERAKSEMRDQKIESDKALRAKTAREEGTTSLLQTTNFNELSQLITNSWAKHFHEMESYGQVVKAHYGKIIPVEEIDQFLKHLRKLKNDASGKKKKDWNKRPLENNDRYKKLCEWVGEDKAREFFNGLPDQ